MPPFTGSPLATFLLPGMDGTGELLEPFAAALGAAFEPVIWRFSAERHQSYASLEAELRAQLPGDRPFGIVAESFSGPLAIRIGSRPPPGLVGLALVATFVRRPGRHLPVPPGVVLQRPPAWALRLVMLGWQAPDDLVARVQANLRRVSPPVLRARLCAVQRADLRSELDDVAVPCMWVTARDDRLIPRRQTREARARRPDFTFETIAGPHLLLQRRPVEAAALVARFLTSRRAPMDQPT